MRPALSDCSANPQPAPEMVSLHGVFLALRVPPPPHDAPAPSPSPLTLGVLIRGEAGVGKSELALELISRGHALVADDAPLFSFDGKGHWYGHCPPPLQDFLEVRPLGILDIRQLFGAEALRPEHRLDLVIHLDTAPLGPVDRLAGAWRIFDLGEARIPELPLPAGRGRHLALLVETAARLLAYGRSPGFGYNAAHELSRRLAEHLGKESL